MHGDLHPGNILVQNCQSYKPQVWQPFCFLAVTSTHEMCVTAICHKSLEPLEYGIYLETSLNRKYFIGIYH